MNPIKTNMQGAWQSLALTLGLKFPISFKFYYFKSIHRKGGGFCGILKRLKKKKKNKIARLN